MLLINTSSSIGSFIACHFIFASKTLRIILTIQTAVIALLTTTHAKCCDNNYEKYGSHVLYFNTNVENVWNYQINPIFTAHNTCFYESFYQTYSNKPLPGLYLTPSGTGIVQPAAGDFLYMHNTNNQLSATNSALATPGQRPGLVLVRKNKLFTTSRIIADKFGKQHAHVLRAISGFSESNFGLADFFRDNFTPSLYKDAQGKPRIEYYLTKDGTAFLIMGFTGPAAAQFKIEFINAFNEQQRIIDAAKPNAELLLAQLTHATDNANMYKDLYSSLLKEITHKQNIEHYYSKLLPEELNQQKYSA